MGRAQLENGGWWIYIKPVCRIVCGRDATVVRVTPVSGVEGLGKESRGCVPVTPHTGRGLRLVCKQLNPDHGRAHREGAPEQRTSSGPTPSYTQHLLRGGTIDELVAEGILQEGCTPEGRSVSCRDDPEKGGPR